MPSHSERARAGDHKGSPLRISFSVVKIHQDGDGEKRCGVDDEYLTMHWSMSLLPDACMIPGKSVFLQAPGGRSLTATVEGVPGLLPGIWEQFLHRCGGEVEEGCYYNRQAQEWINTP